MIHCCSRCFRRYQQCLSKNNSAYPVKQSAHNSLLITLHAHLQYLFYYPQQRHSFYYLIIPNPSLESFIDFYLLQNFIALNFQSFQLSRLANIVATRHLFRSSNCDTFTTQKLVNESLKCCPCHNCQCMLFLFCRFHQLRKKLNK